MNFPSHFISATKEYADFDHQVPAPYLRKKFTLKAAPKKAELLITGLGFYRVFINGTEFTKSILAPYISNPDDVIYYDHYDVLPYLNKGENVIGIILGNGMQNCYGGFVWDFEKAPWRSAPMTALRLDAEFKDGEVLSVESDTTFKTSPSPLLEDDLRSGEVYDARLAIENWCQPAFDDSTWKNAGNAIAPRGEKRLCHASVIKTYEKRKAVSILPYKDGYLYDFGVNTAGVYELKIKGEPGQKVEMFFGEWYHDGVLEKMNIMFSKDRFTYADRVQDGCYICRGGEEESYMPYFSYYGFRYAYVKGVTEEQATEDLLLYHVMAGDFQENASFSCSDPMTNKLLEITRRSTLSNFLWLPTDCPQREKNGWTADVALSAEHMLLNLQVDDSLREWMYNVEKAQKEDGSFPGIVPTGGWSPVVGPSWDQVIVEVPFCLYKLRGDLETAREAAPYIFRYLYYLARVRNKRGLISIGLGDWCETGLSGGGYKTPNEVSSTASGIHLLEEAKLLFARLQMNLEYQYADTLQKELKDAFRKYLIDFSTMTVAGRSQTAQAMAIYYGLFEKGEDSKAFDRLLEMIHQCGNHMNGGALGLRVLFHVLSDHGRADLAYEMITRKDHPSYGNLIVRGATTLWEDFLKEGSRAYSQNHHFFGDISSWFIQVLTGIVPNPYLEDADELRVAPQFIRQLQQAEATYRTPGGSISVHWERAEADADTITLNIQTEGTVHGKISLMSGWEFKDHFYEKELQAGTYVCRKMPE